MLGQRKNTPERKTRLKDIDLTTIAWWSEKFEVLKVAHPNALTQDTTHQWPGQRGKGYFEACDRD